MKGNPHSKIVSDGKTYDKKLYTFRECDYFETFDNLSVIVRDLDPKYEVRNITNESKSQ